MKNQQYVGKKIRIVHLKGENDMYDGKSGTCEFVDSLGQLHGTWGGLAIIPGEDMFEWWQQSLPETDNDK